jgi:hypothetical protein
MTVRAQQQNPGGDDAPAVNGVDGKSASAALGSCMSLPLGYGGGRCPPFSTGRRSRSGNT